MVLKSFPDLLDAAERSLTLEAKLLQGVNLHGTRRDMWGWHHDVRRMLGLEPLKEIEPVPDCVKCQALGVRLHKLTSIVKEMEENPGDKSHLLALLSAASRQIAEWNHERIEAWKKATGEVRKRVSRT